MTRPPRCGSAPGIRGAGCPKRLTPDKRVVTTASGHLVVLDDRDGEERITVADGSGNRIELHSGGLSITCPQGLTIDARGQRVRITADKVEIKKG